MYGTSISTSTALRLDFSFRLPAGEWAVWAPDRERRTTYYISLVHGLVVVA